MTKIPHSFSIDGELKVLVQRYYFINWSQIVNLHLKKHIQKYKEELEELLILHDKINEERDR